MIFPWRVKLGVFLMMTTSGTTASASDVVQIISAAEMDWPEGRRALEGELRASGYQLEDESSAAVEPGLLLEQLQRPDENDIAARVTVVRLGKSGIAYVWLREVAKLYRVTSSEVVPEQAANVLSLRVSELISLRGAGFEVDQSSPVEKPGKLAQSPENLPREPAKKAELNWTILVGAGPSFSSGLSRPMADLHVAIQRAILPLFVVELAGEMSVASAAQEFEQGTIDAAEQAFRLSALLRVPLSEPLDLQLGPAFGLRCFDLYSRTSENPDEEVHRGCSLMTGLQTRLSYHWGAWSLWFAGVGTVNLTPIRLLSEGDVLATLGRPSGSLLGGIGWSF